MRDLRPDPTSPGPPATTRATGCARRPAHRRCPPPGGPRDGDLHAAAKARSVIANVAAQNASLAGIGPPPMVATIAGARGPRRSRCGAGCLSRFPLVARDWDAEANRRKPRTVTGRVRPPGALAVPPLRARVGGAGSQRTMRQTRCQRLLDRACRRSDRARGGPPRARARVGRDRQRAAPPGQTRRPTTRPCAGSAGTTPSTRPTGCRHRPARRCRSDARCAAGRRRLRSGARPDQDPASS